MNLNRKLIFLALLLFLVLTSPLAIATPLTAAAQATSTPNQNSYKTIKIPAPEGARAFGAAMAYDGQTLVVSAPETNVGDAQQQGMVYIYALDRDDPENYELQASVTFTMPMEFALLGEDSVAVKDNTIVIGARHVRALTTSQNGAILIVERESADAEWQVTQFEQNLMYTPDKGVITTMGGFANLGESVAILDGEVPRILVGAPGADIYMYDINNQPRRLNDIGGVFSFFLRDDGTWSPSRFPGGVEGYVALTHEGGESNAEFGKALAVDRQGEIVNLFVGAPAADVYALFDNRGMVVQFGTTGDGPGLALLDPGFHRGTRYGGGLFAHTLDVHMQHMVIGASYADYWINDDAIMYSTGHAVIKGAHRSAIPQIVYASEPQNYAEFGASVGIHDGIVAVGAPGQQLGELENWGAVYRFEQNETGQWVERAQYGVEGLSGGGQLGRSVAVYEGLVIAGAPRADLGPGAVFLFDEADVPPETDPTPRGQVPDNIEHLATVPGNPDDEQDPGGNPGDDPGDDPDDDPDEKPHDAAYMLSIPTMGYAPETAENTPPDAETPDDENPNGEQPGELLPNIQILRSGDIIQSNYGARLGVPTGAMTNAIESYIVAIETPEVPAIQPAETGLHQVGHYYALGTITDTVITPLELPLGVGLPVPPGADPATLSAALYFTNTADADAPEEEKAEWRFVPGDYDSATGLFSFPLAYLDYDGALAVLVSHPDHAAPAQIAASQSGADATNSAVGFQVRCAPRVPSGNALCAPSLADEVEAALINTYNDIVGMGFRTPALHSYVVQFTDSGTSTVVSHTVTYRNIVLMPAPCRYGGVYDPKLVQLRLCVDTTVGVDDELRRVTRHEYFHATQFSYPATRAQWQTEEDWVIEGTAAVAEQSNATAMEVSPRYPPREIDVEVQRLRSDTTVHPYQMQDFWHYVGQKRGVGLNYLIPVLEAGPKPAEVNTGLGGTLAADYWGWVRDQVYEKQVGPAARFTSPACEFEDPLAFELPITVSDAAALPTVFSEVLGPLNALVYEINFSAEISDARVELLRGGTFTMFRMYKEGEGGCTEVPDLLGKSLNAVPGDTIYIVVANTGFDSPELHHVGIYAGGE